MRCFFVILSAHNVFASDNVNQLSALLAETATPFRSAEWVSALDVNGDSLRHFPVEWLWGDALTRAGEVSGPFLASLFKARPKAKQGAIDEKQPAAALASHLVEGALSAHNRAAGRWHGEKDGSGPYVQFFKSNVKSVPLVSKHGVGGYWYQSGSPTPEEAEGNLQGMTKGFQFTVYLFLVATGGAIQSPDERKALVDLALLYREAATGHASVGALRDAVPEGSPVAATQDGHCFKPGDMNELHMKLDAGSLRGYLQTILQLPGGDGIEAGDFVETAQLKARILYCWVSAGAASDGAGPIAAFSVEGAAKIVKAKANEYCNEDGLCTA